MTKKEEFTNGKSQDDLFIEKVNSIVYENLQNENFNVEDLAENLSMSRSTLHRRVKNLKNTSVSQLIRQVRLEEAYKRLVNNEGNASEIAYQVGFSSTSYFFKCFQEYYGFTTSEIKESLITPGSPKKQPQKNKPTSFKFGKSYWSTALALILLLGTIWYLGAEASSNQFRSKKTIAVLPFTTGNIESSRFLADGFVEDILRYLSKIEGLRVIAKTTSDKFNKETDLDLIERAKSLGIGYLLEGSVIEINGKTKVNVRLINTAEGLQVWAESYERNVSDLISMQSEIATQIMSELNIKMSAIQIARLSSNQTTNSRAAELCQLGRYHSNTRTQEGYLKSVEYLNQAIQEDPSYALAYARLADTYHLLAAQYLPETRETNRKLALENTEKALQLNPTLPLAHAVKGIVHFFLDFDYAPAEASLKKAIELNPNYTTALQYYSELLSVTGRDEKARYHLDRAIYLDPLSFIIRHVSAKQYMGVGAYEEALKEIEHSMELSPDHEWAHWDFFLMYVETGNDDQALFHCKKYGEKKNQFTADEAQSNFDENGVKGMLQLIIERTDALLIRVDCLILMGAHQKAIDLLEKAQKEGYRFADASYRFPNVKLRKYPRYEKLLKQINLPYTLP